MKEQSSFISKLSDKVFSVHTYISILFIALLALAVFVPKKFDESISNCLGKVSNGKCIGILLEDDGSKLTVYSPIKSSYN